MSETPQIWRAASELAREGQKAALATVAETRGSTPVPAGEKMLVGPEGRLVGTVGGGCVEAEVIAAALAAQQDGVPRLLTQHLNADLAGDLGLSCGGTVEILVEPVLATPHISPCWIRRQRPPPVSCARRRCGTAVQ